jgi:hypothetical protein
MRENHGIDGRRLERQAVPVALTQVLLALEQSAVEEDAVAVHTQEVLRAGDGLRGT